MANTYSQCYFHLVFAVKNRDALIRKTWKEDLEKYITGIVQNQGHKMLAIGIWRFYPCPFTSGCRYQVHLDSRRAPQKSRLQRGVFRNTAQK